MDTSEDNWTTRFPPDKDKKKKSTRMFNIDDDVAEHHHQPVVDDELALAPGTNLKVNTINGMYALEPLSVIVHTITGSTRIECLYGSTVSNDDIYTNPYDAEFDRFLENRTT
ncbi:hypothetical protein LTR72_011299 [Exophiala xenobiotica]|nr:hypothetical protein LTR72_011299 [Exophiala xenobiotica]KAK5469168.1 hypothetical protein LTR55_011291 [Exophiala xenobiotica]